MHDLRLHIRFRILLYLFAGIVFSALPSHAFAFDVTVVKTAELKPYQDALRGFKETCNCEVREIKPDDEDIAKAVLRKSPEAVVAIGTGAFRNIKSVTGLPVIYTMVMPSEAALSKQPNVFGVSMDISPQTFLFTIRDVFPASKRIGLLYDPSHTGVFVAEAMNVARAAGLELVSRQVTDPRLIPAILDEMRGKIDVFWMLPDATVAAPETVDYLLRFSFQNNVPIFSFSRKYVEMGAVAALDVDPYDMGAQAGQLIKKLKAGQPIPNREWARASHLAINAKVAEKMGLQISAEMIKKAGKHDR